MSAVTHPSLLAVDDGECLASFTVQILSRQRWIPGTIESVHLGSLACTRHRHDVSGLFGNQDISETWTHKRESWTHPSCEWRIVQSSIAPVRDETAPQHRTTRLLHRESGQLNRSRSRTQRSRIR